MQVNLIKFVRFSGFDEDVKAEIWSVDGKLQQTLLAYPQYGSILTMTWNKGDSSIAIRLLSSFEEDDIILIWDLGKDCIIGRTDVKSPFHLEVHCWKDEDTLLILTTEFKEEGWTYSMHSRMANDTSDDLFKSPPVMVFDPNGWRYLSSNLRVST